MLILQVFRSIDSGSLKGFPSDCKEASKQVSLIRTYSFIYFYGGNIENILIGNAPQIYSSADVGGAIFFLLSSSTI